MLLMAQGDIGKRLGDAMNRAGLRPADIVRKSDGEITHARLNNWLKGYNDPSKTVLPKLAALTGASIAELLGTQPLNERVRNRPRRTLSEEMSEIPKIQPIQAGSNWTDPFDSDEFMPIPSFMATPNSFCAPVEGDSMYDLLEPHDLAVFVADRSPKIGMVVLARNNRGEMTIKQLKHDGREYCLHPLNPRYEDLTADSWSIEGFMTGFIRDDGDERIIRHNPRGLSVRR